jgi:UDP-N-acetyl-D-glucosamine dehydrogenase
MSDVVSSAPRTFDHQIATRDATLGIVGLGYAGLPLAMTFAEAGFDVVGVDLNQDRVDAIRQGRSYLVDVPGARYERLDGHLQATSDYAAMSELDAVTICVPTPGTTEEIVMPILERSGLSAGRDFFLGYAPERVDPGNERYTIRNTPKLVAGVTDECRRRTELLYRQIVDDVIPVSSTMVAETAKLHENTFRAVNIALANELALMCSRLGISSWEVIEAASTKPFGFLPHYPGPGLGGDCIPVVPHFLAWRLREYGYSPQLIEAAHEVNAQMPVFVVHKVVDALNETGRPVNGSRVLLLGMAYKPDIHDTRESPSLEVMRQLIERHAEVRYCDPWVEEVELDGTRHAGVEWSPERVRESDCVVLLTPHRRFLSEPLWDEASLIVDTRDVVPEAPNVHRL